MCIYIYICIIKVNEHTDCIRFCFGFALAGFSAFRMISRSWLLVSGSWLLVPGSWFLVLGVLFYFGYFHVVLFLFFIPY